MITEEICTCEVAKLAKDKGFPQDVDRWVADLHSATNSNYYNHKGELNGDCIEIIKCKIQKEEIPKEFELVAAPTQSLMQRWLREEKKVHIEIYPVFPSPNDVKYGRWIVADAITKSIPIEYFDTYEQALEDAELYCLKNLL